MAGKSWRAGKKACPKGSAVGESRRFWVWLGLLGALAAVMGCEAFISQPQYPPPPPPPVAAPPPPSRPTFYVNASRLNLRACPGMDCPRVATLDRNEEVEQIAQTEDWIQVLVKRDGSIGWVANRYLSDRPLPVEMAPAAPAPAVPEPAPPAAAPPERPAVTERPKPAKPPETGLPRRTPKPVEAAEPEPEPAPITEAEPTPAKPVPPEKAVEKPAPAKPQPEPEPPKKIRIM